MKILNKQQKGQTLIETALILFLILLILLGISEFARAWFVKNTLKNAVRQGARVAVVTPNPTTNFTITSYTCDESTCPSTSLLENAVCCQPGVPKKSNNNTSFNFTCIDGLSGINKACTALLPNDTIQVDGTSTFFFIIGGNPWPWSKTIDMTTNASMRYE